MKNIEVVAAIIRKGDKIFATQRGYGEWKDRLPSLPPHYALLPLHITRRSYAPERTRGSKVAL